MCNRITRARFAVYSIALVSFNASAMFYSGFAHNTFADDQILNDFRQNAVSQWTKHRDLSKFLGGTVETNMKLGPTDPMEKMTLTSRFAKNAGVLIQSGPSGRRNSEIAFGFNNDYSFYLTRKNGAVPWMVSSLTFDANSKEAKNIKKFIRPPNFDLTTLGPKLWFDDYVSSPNTILQIVKVEGDLITVSFNTDPHGNSPKSNWPRSAIATFDRTHFWVMTDWQYDGNDGSVAKGVNEFRVVKGFPVIQRRLTFDYKPSNATVARAEASAVYSIPYPIAKHSPDDFRLTAFGLPEPSTTWRNSSKIGWFIVLGVVGVVCLALGFRLWRYSSP